MKTVNKRLVSIVILTWNRKSDLRTTLYKIRSVDYSPIETVVVDNASTDATDKMISDEFPEVKYIRLSKNGGIAGYNVGFRVACGEYVVALDSDSYPAVDAITKMVELFTKYPKAGAVAFDVRCAGSGAEKRKAADEVTGEIFGYHGAGVGFRKEVFHTAGYWYEPFFLYCNEMDHAIRMIKSGYGIIHSTCVKAFHKTSPAARASSAAAYYYTRNMLWLIWRHYPLGEMLSATAYLVYLAVAQSFLQRTTVYLRAVRDAFSNATKTLAEREPIEKSLMKNFRIPLHLVFTRWA